MDEVIIYIARKLHWSKKELGELIPREVNAIMKELQFQEAQEQYRQDHNTASILAAIANTVPRKGGRIYKARDFIGQEPQRGKKKSLEELAKDKGIKLPKGG